MFGVIDAYYYDVGNQRYYIHDCMSDITPTKYITTSEWDFKIAIMNGNYVDDSGNFMWIFEKDDKPYDNIKEWLNTMDKLTPMPYELKKI